MSGLFRPLTAATSLLFLISFAAAADDRNPPSRPPKLTFDQPVDYIAWYNDFVRQGRDEKDNALSLYEKLRPTKDEKSGMPPLTDRLKRQMSSLRAGIWTKQQSLELVFYIARCDSFLQQFEAAAKRHWYWVPAPPDLKCLMVLQMPWMSASKDAVRTMLIRSRLCRAHPSWSLLDTWRTVLSFSNHMENAPHIDSIRCAIAARSVVYSEIRDAAAGGTCGSDEQIVEAYKLLLEFNPKPPDWTRAMLVEWAIQLDALQYLCDRDGPAPERFRALIQELNANDDEPSSVPSELFDPLATRDLIDGFYSELVAAVMPLNHLGFWKMVKLFDRWDHRLAANTFISSTMVSLADSYLLSLRTESERRGTFVVLALRAHHARHGTWPKSLKAIDRSLGLEDLRKLRIDPITIRPYKYKVVDGEPVLYSIGFDYTDNGGKHHPRFGKDDGGDYVFLPHRGTVK